MAERLVFIILCYIWAIAALTTSNGNFRKSRQLDFNECCPCPKVAKDLDDQLIRSEEVASCHLKNIGSDTVGASSFLAPALHALRPDMRYSDPKPLLNPEVDLASSVLETLQQVTEEEYQDALNRDATRSNLQKIEKDILQPRDTSKSIINIILNPKESVSNFETLPEATHVQETRCVHSPLRSSNNYRTDDLKHTPLPIKDVSIKELNQNIYDMDNGASDIVNTIQNPSQLHQYISSLKDSKVLDVNTENGDTSPLKRFHEKTKTLFKNIPDLNLASINDFLEKTTKTTPILKHFLSKKTHDITNTIATPRSLLELQKETRNENKFINFKPTKNNNLLGLNSKKVSNNFKNILKLKDVEIIPKQLTSVPFKGDKKNMQKISILREDSLHNTSVNEDQMSPKNCLPTKSEITDANQSPSEAEIVRSPIPNSSRKLQGGFESQESETTSKLKKSNGLLQDNFYQPTLNSSIDELKLYKTKENRYDNVKLNENNDKNIKISNTGNVEKFSNPYTELSHSKTPVDLSPGERKAEKMDLQENKLLLEKKNVSQNEKKLKNIRDFVRLAEDAKDFDDVNEHDYNKRNLTASSNNREWKDEDINNEEKNMTFNTLQKLSDSLLKLSEGDTTIEGIKDQSIESTNIKEDVIDNIRNPNSLQNIELKNEDTLGDICIDNITDKYSNTTKKYINYNNIVDDVINITAPFSNASYLSLTKDNMKNENQIVTDDSSEMCVQASEPIMSRTLVTQPDLKYLQNIKNVKSNDFRNQLLKPNVAKIHTPSFLDRGTMKDNVDKIRNSMQEGVLKPTDIGRESTVQKINNDNILSSLSSKFKQGNKMPIDKILGVEKLDVDTIKNLNINSDNLRNAFEMAHKEANEKLQDFHINLNNKLKSLNRRINQNYLKHNERYTDGNSFKKSKPVKFLYDEDLNYSRTPINLLSDKNMRKKLERDQLSKQELSNPRSKLYDNMKSRKDNIILGKMLNTKSDKQHLNNIDSAKKGPSDLIFSTKKFENIDKLPFQNSLTQLIKEALDANAPRKHNLKNTELKTSASKINAVRNTFNSSILKHPYMDYQSSGEKTPTRSSLEYERNVMSTYKTGKPLRAIDDDNAEIPLQTRDDVPSCLSITRTAQRRQPKVYKSRTNINSPVDEMQESLQSGSQNIDQFKRPKEMLREDEPYHCKIICSKDD